MALRMMELACSDNLVSSFCICCCCSLAAMPTTLELGGDDNLWPCGCVVVDVGMDLQPFLVPICQYEARK